MFLVKRQHFLIEHVSSGDRRLAGVQLAMSHFAERVNVSLLIDPAHAFQGADQ